MNIRSRKKRIVTLDRNHLWHPFTQMQEWAEETPVIITEGRGVFLKDILGRWYLDGVSSLWVNVHGHRKQEIDDAIKEQVDRISHSTLLGLASPPAAELAAQLAGMAPAGLSRVFYSDNGSTAVEVALKMAFQYWKQRGQEQKSAFVCLHNAYHGDTLGAVSVGGIDLFHRIFSPLLFRAHRIPSPYCYRCELGKRHPACGLFCLQKAEEIIRRHKDETAALIIEPLVQGAGGMIAAPDGYLKGIRRLCRKYGILMIADEVATGFGRTGTMFACEQEQVAPDILCLAKGMSGGYLPLAATMTTEKIYRAFLGKYHECKTFFHGHTYTGNQLACAAGLASLRVFRKERTLQKMAKKILFLGKELARIAGLDNVGDVRQRGFMVGIELVKDKKTREPWPIDEKVGWKVCARARDKGLLIRPLGNVVVLMPPLSISTAELKSLTRITGEAIREATG